MKALLTPLALLLLIGFVHPAVLAQSPLLPDAGSEIPGVAAPSVTGPELPTSFQGLPLPSPSDNEAIRSLFARYRPSEVDLALWYPSPGLRPEGLDGPLRARTDPPLPLDADERRIHKADEAQDLGYTGAGVRVAVVDTGLDFSQPELAGRQARVQNPASPYFLHPIAYDPTSLNDYLLDGRIDGNLSWFVNTSFEDGVWSSGARFMVSFSNATLNRTWDVTGLKDWTVGERVRLGFHPDKKLEVIYDEKVGVALFASVAGGPWDRVVADLDNDGNLWDDKVARIKTDPADADPVAELLYQDIGKDGVTDVSGGMVYFIADGVREIPYAARQIDVVNFVWETLLNNATFDVWAQANATPADYLVPSDGSLVALYGDLGPPGSLGAHGTWVASAIAGQGAVERLTLGPNLTGMAPGVEIIAAGNLWGGDPLVLPWEYALVFVSEGYDGLVGTGDEAHIASNSWGGSSISGWGWSCRLADYLGSVHSQNQTLYMFAAGNLGWGHGNLHCPAGGPSLVTVGASTNFAYRDDPWFRFDEGPNPAFGDIVSFSNRGPNSIGSQYVDVLADGLFGYGADPLNNHYFERELFNGKNAWTLWAGTSLSAPVAAGGMALIYEAYQATHGTYPTTQEAKLLMMASADDVGNDPFHQGAGMLNAFRGVQLASDARGILPNLPGIVPGDYRGASLPGFPRLLHPGQANATPLQLTNVGPDPMPVSLSTATLKLNNSIDFTFPATEMEPSVEFLLTRNGLFHLNPFWRVHLLDPVRFDGADALRVTFFTDLVNVGQNTTYLLEMMDWTDVDADGVFDGVDERNRMVIDTILAENTNGPSGQQFIHKPSARIHDGIYIWLRALDPGNLTIMNVTLQIDYLVREPFSWVALSPGSAVLASGETRTFWVNTTVPADAGVGIHQTALLVAWETNVTTVPITVMVAADGLPFSVPAPSGLATYDNGLLYGAASTFFSGSGDFRFFFVDLQQSPAQEVTFALSWDTPGSWAQAFALAPEPDWFTEQAPFRYGPYGLRTVARNGMPRDAGLTLRANLTAGLNLLVVRSLFTSGDAVADAYTARASTATLTPGFLQGDGFVLEGAFDLALESSVNLPEVAVMGRGFSQGLVVKDRPIGIFELDEYAFTIENGGYIRAVTTGSPGLDIDMVLAYRHPFLHWLVVAFSPNPDSNETVSTSLPRDGNYLIQIFAFGALPNSTYDLTLDVVQGDALSLQSAPPSLGPNEMGTVRLDYLLPNAAGPFQGVVFAGTPANPDMAMAFLEFRPDRPPVFFNPIVAPGAIISNPSPGLSVEMADAPGPFQTAVDPASVRILLDGLDVTAAAQITPTAVQLAVPVILQDGNHSVRVTARDLPGSENATAWNFTVDTLAPLLQVNPLPTVTNASSLQVGGRVEVGASLTVNGEAVSYPPSGIFSVAATLREGAQTVEVRAVDAAGNEALLSFPITLDTQAPLLRIDEPVDEAVVGSPVLRLRGVTEEGVDLTVNGEPVEVLTGGAFDHFLELVPGTNVIAVQATDAAGNVASASAQVTFHNLQEGVSTALLAAIGLLAAAAAAGVAAIYFLFLRPRGEGLRPRQ